MPNAKDRIARVITGAHRAVYRLSGGRVGGRIAGMPVLLLITRGRRTGKLRTTPLSYLPDGDGLVLVASNGGDARHPNWYRNLRADPHVEVVKGRDRRPMTARDAAPEERERLWAEVVKAAPYYGRYQEKTTREIPLVILRDR